MKEQLFRVKDTENIVLTAGFDNLVYKLKEINFFTIRHFRYQDLARAGSKMTSVTCIHNALGTVFLHCAMFNGSCPFGCPW